MKRELDWKLLAALVGSVALGAAFWTSWPLWPLKLLVVMMHESSHALVARLCGASVQSVSVDRFEGGLTTYRLAPSLWRSVLISSAGYCGSAVAGAALVAFAAKARGRWLAWAFSAWLTAQTVLDVRDIFTLVFAVAMAALFALLAAKAPDWLRRGALVFVGSFSCLYALFDIRDDLLRVGPPIGSDADALAALTHIPALVWGLVWGLFGAFLMVVALRAALLRMPAAPGAAAGVSALHLER